MKYSVVIPIYNEEGNINELVGELMPVMQALNEPFEIILVDDGSTDSSVKIIEDLNQKLSCINPIIFAKNYGQTSAFDAGFKAATGEYIITMDGDRQNDPKDIPKLLAVKEFDLVCGIRTKREDTYIKKLTSKLANKFRNYLCEDDTKDTGCSLKIFRSEAIRSIKLFDGLHRHFPILFKIEGYKVTEVPVNHRPRREGVSKYNFFNRSFNTISDLLAVYWMKKRKLKYRLKLDKSHSREP